MDKNRFILLITLIIVILVFLFNYYQKTKNEILQSYQYHQQLLTKIKEIKYLQKTYNNNTNILQRLKLCNIINEDNKIIINCNNLSSKKFKSTLNIIFNSNLNISKFNIQKNTIHVEILK